MINKKREKSKINRRFLLGIVLVLIVINCFGIAVVQAVNDVDFVYQNTQNLNTLIKNLEQASTSASSFNEFKEEWAVSNPAQRQAFLDRLGSDRDDFYKALLKNKYKEIQSVDLGNAKNIVLDEKLENFVIKGTNGEEFKLPINNPDAKKSPLVSIKNENGIIKIAYDPQYDKKENIGKDAARLRTLAITPGLKGSVNSETGNYIDKDGKETQIGLLHGQGGELGLSMKEDKLVVKIDKLNLNEKDKALYDLNGAVALANAAVLKVNNDFFYGVLFLMEVLVLK